MRFFFYGTLIAGGGNPAARLVEAKLRELGPAQARGVLYALPDPDGWYPALLPGEGIVHGVLYEATARFTGADLARLDAYEDYDPARPGRSIYVRTPVAVTGPDGVSTAEAYRFMAPLPQGGRFVAGGDFRVWLAETGLCAFSPGGFVR